MFVVCTNVEGNGALTNGEWRKIRVEFPVNTYMRCQVWLKQINMFSEFTLPHPHVVGNILELRWENHNEELRFIGKFSDAYLPTRVLHLKSIDKMHIWLGEVFTQAKYIDLEYRVISYVSGVAVQHPDMVQFVCEARM